MIFINKMNGEIIYNIVVCLFSVTIPMYLIKDVIKNILERKSFSCIIKKYLFEIALYFFIVIGLLSRAILINKFPIGLNCDEASAGYEAFSILNYGIDRSGHQYPVFLEAWGSGQNALYSYLLIPLIKIFGLNILVTRLPMVIISVISLFVFLDLLKKFNNKKIILLGVFFLAICPWHIMKSRWGLESNLFPDLVLYSVYFLMFFLNNNKKIYLYISFMILGITAYAYGTSYLFLPIYVFLLLTYLLYYKRIKIRESLILLGIVTIISLPIVLYVLINTFDLQEIKILNLFTIPRLPVNRYEQQTTLFAGNILHNILTNFTNNMKMLIFQNDKLQWNCIPGFGMLYLTSLPFTILGIIFARKEKKDIFSIIGIWFISSILLMFVFVEANINRINILIFPMIFYTIYGFVVFINNDKFKFYIILFLYLFQFIIFEFMYFKQEDSGYTFVANIKEVIEFIDEYEDCNKYIDYSFKEPYIYILYYTGYNANKYIETVEHIDRNSIGKFENIKSFGNYYFYIPSSLKENELLVLNKNKKYNVNYENCEIIEFKEFIVLKKI